MVQWTDAVSEVSIEFEYRDAEYEYEQAYEHEAEDERARFEIDVACKQSEEPNTLVNWLPHVNVSLNSLATLLLIVGFVLIKSGKEKAHRNVMLATFAVSIVFLASYLTYHFQVPSKKFPTDTSIAPLAARYFYYGLLLSHVVLAATVPLLAIWAIWNGLAGKREAHRRVVKWAWPIWLYVSVTGVIVYLMLYQIYVPVS